MFLRPFVTFTAAVAIAGGVVVVSARQGGGLGTPNQVNDDPFAGQGGARKMTPVEEFADKLHLDAKTQVPAVQEILSAASRDAGPVGQQMLQLRERMLNVALGNGGDAKTTEDGYAAAAAKMAGIEAAAFAKVYALLKPNQQKDAAQAFTIMAGMFQPAAPAGGGGARGGRRGGGQ